VYIIRSFSRAIKVRFEYKAVLRAHSLKLGGSHYGLAMSYNSVHTQWAKSPKKKQSEGVRFAHCIVPLVDFIL